MLRPLPIRTRGPLALAVVVGVLSPLLAGCETSVVIDPPPLEEALVVYSFPQPDSVWAVRVGRTLPLGTFDNGDPTLGEVRDATVRLYEDGALLDDLVVHLPAHELTPPPALRQRAAQGVAGQAGQHLGFVADRLAGSEKAVKQRLAVTAEGIPELAGPVLRERGCRVRHCRVIRAPALGFGLRETDQPTDGQRVGRAHRSLPAPTARVVATTLDNSSSAVLAFPTTARR